jgi:hypothetical protein
LTNGNYNCGRGAFADRINKDNLAGMDFNADMLTTIKYYGKTITKKL